MEVQVRNIGIIMKYIIRSRNRVMDPRRIFMIKK